MKVVRNSLFPCKGFKAMLFFGILFVRNDLRKELTYVDLNHESIHVKQCKELLGVFFYLWYVLEYLVRLPLCDFNHHKAYRSICFEQEAYDNESNLQYINERKHWAWLKYYKNKK